MKILFVGGDFNFEGGKPSSIVDKFCKILIEKGANVDIKNGGNFSEIETILNSTINYDVVFWWPNVPNDLEKLRNVKEINPHTILISSKRNDANKYTFAELIKRALDQKSNLVIQFSKEQDKFSFMLFDPLGTFWYNGTSIEDCCQNLMKRLKFLISVKRIKSVAVGDKIDTPDEVEFFKFVKNSAEIFHELINPEKTVTRFLGNSSFRCLRGFPSFKHDNLIFVSRRNIDKEFIDKNGFVATYLSAGNVCYYGKDKPSVDTPIQLNLYNLFPKINYMIHSHCYVENGIFTKYPVPCGAIEEIDEIKKTIKDFNQDFYKINLIGHGCLIMSSSVENFNTVKYIKRNMPEDMSNLLK